MSKTSILPNLALKFVGFLQYQYHMRFLTYEPIEQEADVLNTTYAIRAEHGDLRAIMPMSDHQLCTALNTISSKMTHMTFTDQKHYLQTFVFFLADNDIYTILDERIIWVKSTNIDLFLQKEELFK